MPRIFSKSEQYTQNLFVKEDKLLQDITNGCSGPELVMQIAPSEGKLLYILLKLMNARSAIEIGMLAGYSATWIARALGDGGKLYCFERNLSAIELYKTRLCNSEIENRIKFIGGDALSNLTRFSTPVDVIFIDADKASYPSYFEHANRLLKNGGLLIADNVFLYGNVFEKPRKKVSDATKSAMIQFNNLVAKSDSFESIIIPTHEGLLIARKCV